MKLYFPGVLAVIFLGLAIVLLGSSEVSSSRGFSAKKSASTSSTKTEKVSGKISIDTIADSSESKNDLAVLPMDKVGENGELVEAPPAKLPN